MHKPVVILMARWPAPNRCKKRLGKDIGPYRAALIQKKLTSHSLSVANNLRDKGLIETHLAIDGLGPEKAKQWGQVEKVDSFSIQGEGNLGLRMKRQFLKSQRREKYSLNSIRKTIVIGTDLPTLSELELIDAIEKLEKNELVIGPANDGGYWLLGLSGNLLAPVASWPFTGIRWGTPSVLVETINKAKSLNVKFELTKQLTDLDQLIDVIPWLK